MTTDEEAEAFLEQDLSDLDFSQFKPVKFEFQAKAARLNMRLPVPLLDAVKASAKARGVPYTRFIREVLERATAEKPRGTPALNFAPPFVASRPVLCWISQNDAGEHINEDRPDRKSGGMCFNLDSS
jgi:predicted DNA binding CopG/RHH family protein